MSARVVWKGLAVVDTDGRVVTWRGSETPKLFHSEEQAQHHRVDGCTLQPVTLVHGSITGPEYTRHTPDRDAPSPARPIGQPPSAASPTRLLVLERQEPSKPGLTFDAAKMIPRVPTKARRQYKPKPCAGCKRQFHPSGPRSRYCPACP